MSATPPVTLVDTAATEASQPGERAVINYQLSPELVTLSDARPAEAEAIRTVRTHIMARHLEDGRRGLAVCSATAGVGCTFTAVNLAVALSQVGVTTLLIDADLRAPQVETLIRPSAEPTGLRQCLSGPGSRPTDFIHHEVLPDLSVMFAGGVADNALELLASDAFKHLLEGCLRDFEFTIIDCPALATAADALRISSVIGYAVVVAKANVTRSKDIKALAKLLEEDGAEVIGTVLSEI